MIVRRVRRGVPTVVGLDVEMTHEFGSRLGRRAAFCEPWRPPTEVFEHNDALIVRVEIAGVRIDDLDVAVIGEELFVRGERPIGSPSTPRIYHESRIRYGPFEAAVRLPFPVAVDETAAEYVDGLLCIRLPRRAAAKVPMRDGSRTQSADRGDV